jgi:adenylate cyclase
VTTQLIDALKGYTLWSERYDRSVKDIFALEDEITMKIITELRVNLTEGEVARMYAKGTNNLQAYLKVLEGSGYHRQYNKESEAKAIRLYREAIALDPHYSQAYYSLSFALANTVLFGASESPKETLSEAMKSAQKAVQLDNSSAEARAAVSNAFLMMRQYDKAIEAAERDVKLNPNSSSALGQLAQCLVWTWRGEEALPVVRQAIRLNPFVPSQYRNLGAACRQTKRYEEGIIAEKKALKLAPNDAMANIGLAGLYMYAGRQAEARAAAAEVYRINPNFSLENFSKVYATKEGPERDRLFDALRKAGLK